jgi:drug/metabolite transporter (DMT)-like permease
MPREIPTSESSQHGVLLLVLGGALISLSAVFVRLADVGPTVSGFYRNLFGAVALFVLIALRAETLWRGWIPFLYALLAAAFFAGDIFFWHRSIHYVGPGLATIMGNGQVFFLAAVGVVVFREKVTVSFVVAIPMSFVGLLMLVGADWFALGDTYRAGVLFGLLTALTYAGYLLTLRRSQRAPVRLGAAANLAIVTTLTAAFLLPAVYADGESLRVPNAQTWLILVAYGVVCQGIAWAIISRALRTVDASRAGLLLLLQPTLTFLWDVVFFKRPTSALEACGAVVALVAIYLGNRRQHSEVPAQRSREGRVDAAT